MNHRLLLLLSVLACFACAPLTTRQGLDIVNADLRTAYDHYDQTMAAPRPPLRFASGQTVQDCRGYLEQRHAAALDEAVNNRIAAQAYLVCDTVAALRGAHPLGAADYRPESYGRDLLNRLDLRAFPSSLRPAVDDDRFTLAALAAGTVRIERHSVTVETDDWQYRFEVVADIDSADGEHEWLLWFSDVAKAGNYRDYETLAVRDPAPTGPLTARPLHRPSLR